MDEAEVKGDFIRFGWDHLLWKQIDKWGRPGSGIFQDSWHQGVFSDK